MMKGRKRCLSEFEIQALIDGELSADERSIAGRHAEKCNRCALRIEELGQWTMRVKQTLRSADPTVVHVPVYEGSEGLPVRRRIGRVVRRLAGIAALVALAVITTTIISDRKAAQYKPTAHDLMLWEENSAGNDANRLWHDRAVTIMITGPKGEFEIINLN
jgi:anti-sigma factor RsiW